jgi:hypothetical protein
MPASMGKNKVFTALTGTLRHSEVSPDRSGFKVLDGLAPGDLLTWDEVSEIHSVRNGINQKNGVLVSLLTDFGRLTRCYPDFHGDTTDVIHYTGAGRRGNQKLDVFNRALLDAIGRGQSVPLFNKLKVGTWQFLGLWRVSAGEYVHEQINDRMVWKFRLERFSD